MSDTGRYLASLRASGAAGIHVPSGTRGSAKRDAIAEQMEDTDMDDEENVVPFPAPLEMESGPSDEEIIELDKEALKVAADFASICEEYGITPDGEDYVPETDAGSLDDYRVVSGDPEEEYEWVSNN